jgi:transcription initiation factor IIE alpha subunit
MGQGEIFNFLKNNEDMWFTNRQIAEKIGASLLSVRRTLKVMRDTNQIEYKKKISKDFHKLTKRKVFTYKFKN